MNKTFVIAGSVVGALAIGAGAAAIVMNQPSTTTDPFSSSTVDSVYIVQHGAHGFDLSFDLADTALAEDPDFSIQLSENPDYVADQAIDLTFDQDGAHITVPTQQLTAGDHYLWLTTPDGRLPALITIPDMASRIWMDGEHPTIEFGESGDSSWSSYVDPEGKAVYRSASPAFGADAVPLREGLAITETNFRVEDPDSALPYYFLVFTGRDGHSTFVSSPLFATATQGNLDVKLVTQGGVPTYLISGFLASRESAIDRSYQLRVGNFNPSNPGSTFLVDSTYEGGAVGQFLFEVPALELAEGWSDLSIFLTEDGSTLEWSIDATGVDLSQRLVVDHSVFGLRRVEALQLTRLDLLYQSINVSLVKSGDTALLKVSGSFTDDAMDRGYGLVVKDADGERHAVSDTAGSARKFAYSLDLGALSKAEVWYDVEFAEPGSDETVPISTLSVADMRQWVTTGSRTYAFADYDGLLKVFFDKKPFANAKVELATVDGVPSLVATGHLIGVAKNDAALRIRTDGVTVKDVANSSTVAGEFRFVFDVRTLTTEGAWYDVVFRQISKDRLTDFSTSSATLSQTLTENFRTYGFQDFNGQLKVDFTRDLGGVDVTSAEIVDVGGTPVLRVEGTLDRAVANDVFLRVRSGAQTFDVPNTATVPDTALFEFDLSGLTAQSVWYDVLTGVTSTGRLTDVPSAAADLSQTVALDQRAYGFHEWDSQLKVAFEDASVTVSGAFATLADVAGVPTLHVTGSVTGTTSADTFLRIRTGAQTIDVPNSASAGALEFDYDLSALTQAGTWYDLVIGVTSSGTLIDLPPSAAVLSQTLWSNGRTYGFREYAGTLKVTFDVTPFAVTATHAELLDVAGVGTLHVTGTVVGTTNADVFLRIRTGVQTIDVANSATTAGELEFTYNLATLTQTGTWYDLLVGVTSSGQLTDIPDSVANLSQTVSAGGRAYTFQQYNNQLKVAFSATAGASVTAAEIVDVSGVPTLRVSGTLSAFANSDVFLRIRTATQTIDVPNTGGPGALLFEQDLSPLTQAGTWYDVLVGVTSTGTLTTVPDSVASLSQTVSGSGRAYSFHEYNHDLKLAFENVPISASITSAQLIDISGVSTLRVSGTLSGTNNGDAFLRIHAGAQTVNVPNTAVTSGALLFEYDLSGLTAVSTDYDLLVGITSNSQLTDLADSVANLSQTIANGSRIYSFDQSGNLLKVSFDVVSVSVTSAELVDVSGVSTLRVSGTVSGTGSSDVFLRIRTGAQTVDVPNTGTSGAVLFEYDLASLTQSGAWYDLLVGVTTTGSLTDISDSVATLSQTITNGNRIYSFHEYNNDLKVEAVNVVTSVTSAQLVSVSGVATLRVTGTVSGVDNGDVFLRVRTAGQTVNVPNTGSPSGALLFEYGLSPLTEEGAWYDLLIGVTPTGTLTDLPVSAADMSQSVSQAGRAYGFRDFSGQLKVTFDNVPIALSVTSAELVNASGVATLQVSGTVSGTTNDDVFLRISTAGQTFDLPNTATAQGTATFTYDLAGLTESGEWYTVEAGVTSTSSLTDVSASVANLAQTVTRNDHTYSFHDLLGALRLSFGDAAASVAVDSSELLDVSGIPTLRVSGTVEGTADDDVFLRIRSGVQTVDVSNTAATPGLALFEYDLSGLTADGTNYELLVGSTSTGTLVAIGDSTATLTQSVALSGRTYGFTTASSKLRVAFEETPVAATATSAEIVDVSGVPTLRVAGTVVGTSPGDVFVRIHSGTQTVDVSNTATAFGATLFEYDLTGLTGAGDLYDLELGIASTSQLTDLSDSIADLSQSLTAGNQTYSFHEVSGDLKVAFVSVAVTSAELVDVSGVSTLRVAGTMAGTTSGDLFLRVSTGAQTVDVPNTGTSGALLFEYDLSALTEPATWYSLKVGVTSTGVLTDVSDSTANLSQTITNGNRIYTFHEVGNRLKVAFDNVVVSPSSAELLNLSGVPTLRVTGSVTGTSSADVFLRIHTAAQNIDVPNTGSSGALLFEYNVAGLTQAGLWYDLQLGVTTTAQFTNISDSLANLAQSITVNSRNYSFHNVGSVLKVAYVSVAVTASSSELLVVSGVPTLRVTGTVTGTSNADTFLKIRNAPTFFEENTPNVAGTQGSAQFDYDLSGLVTPGTWYDVVVGVTSTGSLVDVLPATANMAQTITVNNRVYTFQQFSGQLKVQFTDNSKSGTITNATITNVSGVPTLTVTATATNTTAGDLFLRIKTTSQTGQTVNVSNTAPAGGTTATFTYNLSGLSFGGTWYDMQIGVTSTGALSDQLYSASYAGSGLNVAGRTYGFHVYNGLLKVSYDNVTLGLGQSIRIDFGPKDTTNGVAVVSPDVNGKYWNNVAPPTGNTVSNGLAVTGMVTTANAVTSTGVTINGTNWLSNGLASGGLRTPTVPNLGEFAIPTVTEDYFFVQSSGTANFTVSGLDPSRLYDFKFFGTRIAGTTNTPTVRSTTYSVVGSNTPASKLLQTSGSGSTAGGTAITCESGATAAPCYGNNFATVTVTGAQPTSAGAVTVSVTATTGTFGYLGFMEITGSTATAPPPAATPAEVQRWVSQDAANPYPANSVLFVGSSSIRRWESLTRDFADYNIIQRGWGGAWLSGVNDYAPWVVAPYNPSAIVMWAGTNDLSGGKSAAQLLADFRTFVSNEHADSPSTDILYISPTPNPGNGATDAVRRQANDLIEAECATDPKLHFIDIATYFENLQASDPTAWNALYIDQLHMTPAGYQVWVSMVRPALEAVVAPNKSAAVNPGALTTGEKLLFDFGPNDPSNGDATGTDTNGNHWNNWVATNGGGLVNAGEHIAGLVDTTGRNTGAGMTITAGFQANGKATGGLLAPNPALLGDLGVATATEDYFYSSADGVKNGTDDDLPGGFMLTGLDPSQTYDFTFFGSRAIAETRVTQYTVRGANSASANLQTSGTGIGGGGTYAGNDSQVATVAGIQPDAFGQVFVDLTVVQGSFTHINAMEVVTSVPPAPLMSMMSFTEGFSADEEIPGTDATSLPIDETTPQPDASATPEADAPVPSPEPTTTPEPTIATEPVTTSDPGTPEETPTGEAALLLLAPLAILAGRGKRIRRTRRPQ